MQSYKVFNFDHKCKKPENIITDSFRIVVENEHCKNLEKLARRSSITYTFDHEFTPIVVNNYSFDGGFEVTAIIEIEDEFAEKSLLFPSELNRTFINDITLILSFLTGRRIYLAEEIDKYTSKFYLDGPVISSARLFPQIKYQNIQKIAQLQLDTQFFNVVQSCSINDLLSLTSYCNSSLDKLFTKWAKENNKTKFENSNLLKSISKKAYEYTSNSICNSTKIKFLKLLSNAKVDSDIIEDIKARIRIETSPSAIYKLKSFLQHYDLYPQCDDENNNVKLKWLNKIRNAVAHSGELPKDNKISWAMRAEITTNITFLMLDIIQWYFAKIVLEIDDYRLDATKKDIRKYFETGKFRNKDVFNETYEEYMNRVNLDWVENHTIS